jgi:hypothetical protein
MEMFFRAGRNFFLERRLFFVRLQNYFMRNLYSLASEITSLMEKKFCLIKDGCPFLDNLWPSSGNLSLSVRFLLPENRKRQSRVLKIRNKIFIKFKRNFQREQKNKFCSISNFEKWQIGIRMDEYQMAR